MKSASILQKAKNHLSAILTQANVPESHGLNHALKVLQNLDSALEASTFTLTETETLCLQLAALLHDADDRKYFASQASEYQNAVHIMHECLEDGDKESIIKSVTEMISYVSASGNGNSVPEAALSKPYLLWPRYSDRLEAIGTIGMVRCFQYNTECGAPLSHPDTPRPKTSQEVWAEVLPCRFDTYMKTKTSRSMMDHYYDKLLHIAVFDPAVV